MARNKKFLLQFQTDNGTFYKIEVFDNDSADTELFQPKLGSDGFSLTYQTDTDNRFTALIPSEVKFDIYIENDDQEDEIINIRHATYGQYDVGIYKSLDDSSYDLYWAGVILNDISNEKDVDYPRGVTLTAIDGLAALKDKPFNEDVGYNTPSSFQVIAYFKNAFRLQIPWTDNYINAGANLVKTYINWSTDSAGYVAHRDPLNFSRFNFMAFVDVNEDDGTKEYKDTFFLLDSICKSFCARCFFSEGTWHIVSVNNYDKWLTPFTNFVRTYDNSGSVNLVSSGSVSENEIEGSGSLHDSILRFGADFGMLPVLKEVKGQYAHLSPFDIPFISYNNNSNTSTDYEFSSNEIPIWNGYRYNNVNYTGSSYGFNLASSDKLIINLGTVAAITGSSILINRDFQIIRDGAVDFSDVTGANDNVLLNLALRFRLVGNSGTTHYFVLNNSGNTDWITTNIHPITQIVGPELLQASSVNNNDFINVNVQTTELPESGQLFFEAYAKCYYNNYASVPSSSSQIEILNTTSTIDPTKILIFSAPENDENKGIKYLLNNEIISSKFFISNNAPGGTIINDGAKLELDESFFGTGPTSGAVGRLETFDFSNSSFDDGTNATWKAFGTGTGVEFTQLQVNQVLKGQMNGARIFNGSLKITNKNHPYNFLNGLRVGGTGHDFAPYQVTYNANQEVWSGVWYEANLSTNTQTTSNGVISDKPDSVGVVPTLDNFLNNISLGVTSADTTSLTLTSIGLIPADGNEKIIKSGDVVNVICSDTGALKQFTANADVNQKGGSLQFASTTIDQIIPAGSLVMMNREKLYERTHSSFQYITFSSQAAAQAEWITVSSSGISNHTWNTVTTDTGTTVNVSQLTNISTAIQSVGIVVPFDCELIGVRAIIYRVGNFQTAVGLFCGTPAYNDNATQNFTLRAYAAADNSAGPDSNYSQRPVKAEDLTRSKSLSAGDIIIPAFNSVTDDGGNARITYTIVLKTLKLL